MPINQPDLLGTEADSSKSEKYCVYCYQDGKFTQPDITLEQVELSAKGWSETKTHLLPVNKLKLNWNKFYPT
jgi:hypothetical protein